jgi:hypothetical protein
VISWFCKYKEGYNLQNTNNKHQYCCCCLKYYCGYCRFFFLYHVTMWSNFIDCNVLKKVYCTSMWCCVFVLTPTKKKIYSSTSFVGFYIVGYVAVLWSISVDRHTKNTSNRQRLPVQIPRSSITKLWIISFHFTSIIKILKTCIYSLWSLG